MTVSSTTTKNSYSGNGSLTVFAYGFKIFDEDNIQVILRNDATGTETVQTITTDYSVSNVGNANGGNITFVTAPASGITVVLRRASPLTQTTDYTPNDPFPAESHEDALDKLTFISQQLQEEVDRSIKLSRTNTMTSTEFTVGAADRANKVLAFDGNGEINVAQELGVFKGNWSSGTAFVARDIVKDTSTNNIFIANTAHTSSGSEPLTTNTDSAKWDLIVDAASATTSATNAATSASDAQKLAINAEDSQYTLSDSTTGYSALHYAAKAEYFKDTALTQASDALNSATDSTNARAGSIAARNAAFLALDDFDDIYLGSMADSQTQSVVNTTATWVTTIAQETQITVADATGISVGMVITSANGFLAETNVLSVVGTTVYLNNVNQTNETNQAVTFTGHGVFGNFDGTKDGPSTNNDGSALAGGELYYNSTDSMLRYYNSGSSSWDDVTLSSANLALVNTVAGQISPTNNLATVAGIDSEITTVAGINTTHLSNVSGVATEIGLLGTADAVADMNTLGTAAIVTDMDLLADRATDIGLLADIEDGTTATNAIQTVAANLSGITAFADVYSSGPTDPTTNLNEGDLFFNTTSDTLKVYNGSAWVAGVTAGSGFLPLTGGQLTGNLTFSGSETVDGRDVSADGTKLDGIEAGATADQTASEILTAVKTVDGAASGLDADLLDGQQGSYYLDANNFTNMPPSDVVGDTTPQLGGTLDVNSNDIDFGQSNKALFGGAGGDLEIYHNGTNAFIDNNDGILYIRNNVDGDDGSDIYIQAKSGENGIIVQDDGEVQLYYNGVEKLNTSNTGITVAGTVAATSYTGDGSSLTGISAGATGGGSDQIFYENGQTVTTNYTITNGKNAMSAGPITINTGVTVTVGTGETWTVV